MIIDVSYFLNILSGNNKYLQLLIMLWRLTKRRVKYIFFCFRGYLFFIKIYWNGFCSIYNLITRNHWIASNTSYILTIFATTYSRIPNIIFFAHMMFFQIFTLTLTFIIIPLLIKLHFLSSNLHSHSHDICFVKTFSCSHVANT